MDMDDTKMICLDDYRETIDVPLICLNHKCRELSVVEDIYNRPNVALDLCCPKCGSKFFATQIGDQLVIVFGETTNGKKSGRKAMV